MSKSQETPESGEALLLPGVAAKLLGVSTTTLAALATTGTLSAITLPSGHRRYVASSVRALAEGRKSA